MCACVNACVRACVWCVCVYASDVSLQSNDITVRVDIRSKRLKALWVLNCVFEVMSHVACTIVRSALTLK